MFYFLFIFLFSSNNFLNIVDSYLVDDSNEASPGHRNLEPHVDNLINLITGNSKNIEKNIKKKTNLEFDKKDFLIFISKKVDNEDSTDSSNIEWKIIEQSDLEKTGTFYLRINLNFRIMETYAEIIQDLKLNILPSAEEIALKCKQEIDLKNLTITNNEKIVSLEKNLKDIFSNQIADLLRNDYGIIDDKKTLSQLIEYGDKKEIKTQFFA